MPRVWGFLIKDLSRHSHLIYCNSQYFHLFAVSNWSGATSAGLLTRSEKPITFPLASLQWLLVSFTIESAVLIFSFFYKAICGPCLKDTVYLSPCSHKTVQSDSIYLTLSLIKGIISYDGAHPPLSTVIMCISKKTS